MSEDLPAIPARKRLGWTTPLLILAVIVLLIAVVGLVSQRTMDRIAADSRQESEMARIATEQAGLRAEIEGLQRASAQREAGFATRDQELAQREAAIAGREDAATERTQSSFQGLLIQQSLLKNLEALKAGLPDMTPEVERLAKEHAQFDAELQRLRKENAELRRKGNTHAPLESR